jgi:hypothetical protein
MGVGQAGPCDSSSDSKEAHITGGVGVGQLRAGGWNAGGLEKKVFVHLLSVQRGLQRWSATAINESEATKMLWGRGWEQAEQKEVLGLRVRAKLASGNLEGNVIRVEGSRVQVRGTLERGEKGAKTCKLVTEKVELKACRFVEDRLTWHDHDIPSTAVRRVEFQKSAKQTSDFLEETVVNTPMGGKRLGVPIPLASMEHSQEQRRTSD